jgi:membrane protease YdiL (CAAX protease family)
MMMLIGLPKLLAIGPVYVLGLVVALPSGIGQQLLFLLGLFGPLEAATRRPAAAAVISSLAFALVHVPLILDENHGDLLAAVANAILFQASVGLIAALAYTRHRAAVPIGVAHALAIA